MYPFYSAEQADGMFWIYIDETQPGPKSNEQLMDLNTGQLLWIMPW